MNSRIWCTYFYFTLCSRPWRLHWNAGISTVDSHSPPKEKKTKEISHKSDLITITKDLSITVLSIYPSKNIFQGFQIILNRPLKRPTPSPCVFFDHYCAASEVVAPGNRGTNDEQKDQICHPKKPTKKNEALTSWWFQPVWKILVKMGIF